MSAVNWGIIGCGDIVSRNIGPALTRLENCAVRAICRNDPDKLNDCAQQLNAATGYENWRDLLADEIVDAVYIATPVAFHAEQTIAAAEAGKHVLCEKPMALNSDECRRMIDVCRRNNTLLGISYYRHYFPAVERMKEIIASGEIGDVILAEVYAAETFLPTPDDPRHWIIEMDKAGGGCLMDFGCHRIEVLLKLLGAVKRATGVIGNIYTDNDVEDTATVSMVFANDATGLVSVTRGGTLERDKVIIQGTRGAIRVDTLSAGWMTIANEEGTRRETLPCHEIPHLPLIEAFCRSIREKTNPAVDGRIGLAVQEVIETVYKEAT